MRYKVLISSLLFLLVKYFASKATAKVIKSGTVAGYK
jgi:hypothetical protein